MSYASLRLWRCLQLLNLLQSRIVYSANDLAREFEVSTRTIYRDFRFLEKAGIPIQYDRKKGGYVLPFHGNLGVSKLSGDELVALLLAGHIFSLSCAPKISNQLHQAISKLLAQMPMAFRDNMGNLLNSIRGKPNSDLWPIGQPLVLAEIFSSISQKRQVRIVFSPPGKITRPIHTKVTPDCLMASSDGRWYLVGRSSWHRKTRRFDLVDIQFAEQVEDSLDQISENKHDIVNQATELAEYAPTILKNIGSMNVSCKQSQEAKLLRLPIPA